MTDQEYEAFQESLARSKMKQNEFVLSCILNKKINVMEGFLDVSKALRQIGNNLNQIAKAVNSGNATSQPVVEELQKGVDELWQLLRRLKAGRV